MICSTCKKEVPGQYEGAHREFHARGDRSKPHPPRSAERAENLRLSRIRHRQVQARATA